MNKILSHLFRDKGEIAEINLSVENAKMFNTSGPLLDSEFCFDWVKYLHRLNKVKYSFGDYLADRSSMLAGCYLAAKNTWIHLGVDISTSWCYDRVYSPLDAEIIDILCDADQNGGWGNRITLNTKNGIVAFGHLTLWSGLKVGQLIKKNESFGFIAGPDKNGGWWPHLHLQGLRDISLLKDLDGYGNDKSYDLSKDYPNPLKILELI